MNSKKGILVIHVKGNAENFYGHPYQSLIQHSANDILTFDIDSQSEPYTIQLAEKFLLGIENKLIIVHVAPQGGEVECFLRLFANLARKQSGRLRLFCYPSLPNMLSRFDRFIEMTVFSEREKLENEVVEWIEEK